jgi:hypothetical protein
VYLGKDLLIGSKTGMVSVIGISSFLYYSRDCYLLGARKVLSSTLRKIVMKEFLLACLGEDLFIDIFVVLFSEAPLKLVAKVT